MKFCIWMTGLLAGAALAGVVQASPLPLEGRDCNSSGTSMVDWDTAVRWASMLTVGGFSGCAPR
ncbi:MAG: hypothetical protein Q7T97_15145 [Burkholderiaceae bacterium]|nr:hypothetical protein [Burkholderiaceae bacterium]